VTSLVAEAEVQPPPSLPPFKEPESGFPPAKPVGGWKRALDMCLLVLLLPIAGPVFLLAAAWVSLISAGRVLFVQERVGHGGKRFRCFKLRTMREGCSVATHQRHLQHVVQNGQPMLKLDDRDPRLIPGARVIRALGIDELPQLINVFRGEMSIVGPRPCIPYEAEQYSYAQRERFSALPGMTGLWQVRGKNRLTFQEMVRLDIQYAREQSLGLDLRILAATPKAVLLQLAYTLWNRANSARRPSSRRGRMPIPSADGSSAVG
jgi:lipopolysaccharide/colanic/teichoic acid biosynthesis glycosyltransferase